MFDVEGRFGGHGAVALAGSLGYTVRLLRRVAVLAAGGQGPPAPPRLTMREHEIVRLIEQGLANKEIASGQPARTAPSFRTSRQTGCDLRG